MECEQSVLENLYHQHFNKTYRTAYMVTGDHQMAEDATQEAFLKAFVKMETLKDLNKFGAWVGVIASNYAIDLLRKRKRMLFSDNVSEHADSNPGFSPQESWEKTESCQEIRNALAALEPEEREILVLKYFNELSIKEIALVINAPAGTIKSRLFRARKKVKALLQPGRDYKRQLSKTSNNF